MKEILNIEIQEGEMPLVIIEEGKLPRTEKHRDLKELEKILYPTTDITSTEDMLHERERLLKINDLQNSSK